LCKSALSRITFYKPAKKLALLEEDLDEEEIARREKNRKERMARKTEANPVLYLIMQRRKEKFLYGK